MNTSTTSLSLPKKEIKSRTSACHNLSFDPFQRFHKFLRRMFSYLGQSIALYPSYFIIFPLFFSLLGITGFQRVLHEDDPEMLFYPKTGPAPGERAVIESHFPINYTTGFLPYHMTRPSGFVRILLSQRDGSNIFKRRFWRDLKRMDDFVRRLNITYKGRTLVYEDICARWKGNCYENRILNLDSLIPEIENGNFYVNYPIMLFPLILPMDFGGMVIDDRKGIITSAKSVSLSYFLKQNTEEESEIALLWEQNFLDHVKDFRLNSIDFAYFAARSRKDEMLNNTNAIKPYSAITGVLLVLFGVVSVISRDWVRGKIYLGLIGIVSAGIATATAFGFLMYLGIPFISINKIIPFLMIGIGIDDMFVVLASWRRTKIQDPIVKRLSETYADAGVSITITSLTNMLSFSVGVTTPILGVQIFCIYTTLAVILTYFWHLTFFGGCLAIAGAFEKNQRHSLLCIKVKSKSELEKNGKSCYSMWCGGGINAEDPWNERDNRPQAIMVAFGHFGKFLSIPLVKAGVLCLFLLYLGGAIYGCTTLKEGLDKEHVVQYDSYAMKFYRMESEQFRKFPYPIQIILTGNITYSNHQTRYYLLKLHKDLEKLPYTAENIFTNSWIRGWYRFLDSTPSLSRNITDEKTFIKYLRSEYLNGPSNQLSLDVKFNKDYSRIIASRFIIQTYEINSTQREAAMMAAYRAVGKASQFNVTVFNPNFILFDQYTMVQPITIQAVAIAVITMVIISLIFIPNPWCSLLVGIAILSIETGVVGYMSLWGVNLDQISMINLIMCIGFSVDFSAHISYAYLTAKASTTTDRLRECLYSLGLPIVQGGLSTVICIITFTLAPSYVYITFFKIVFLVVVFATIHGLLLIPVLLSMFQRESHNDLTKANIKIPRVKLNKKDLSLVIEDKEIVENKKESKGKLCHENKGFWKSNSKLSAVSRPDPEGCSNRSFGKDSETKDETKECESKNSSER